MKRQFVPAALAGLCLFAGACDGEGGATPPATDAAAAQNGVAQGEAAAAGLRGEYFKTIGLGDRAYVNADPRVDFDWGAGSPAGLPADEFSARWTGRVVPRHSETYTFVVEADDGVRLDVDGRRLVDAWGDGSKVLTGAIALQAGQAYDFRLDYFEHGGKARVRVKWKSPSQAEEVVPASQFLPPADGGGGGVKDEVEGNFRGYWTTPQELRALKKLADEGVQPFKKAYQHLRDEAKGSFPGKSNISGTYLVGSHYEGGGGSGTFDDHFYEGGKNVYAKAIVYQTEGNRRYAEEVKKRLLDLTDVKFAADDNDAPLLISWQLPAWVQAADLLEDFWSRDDKRRFQTWLKDVAYARARSVGEKSDNNWGSAASYFLAVTADYLHDSGLTLKEGSESLSPGQAFAKYRDVQFRRMKYKTEPMEPKDTACDVNGIMEHGGIPAELRRAEGKIDTSWCGKKFLDDDDSQAFTYQITHVAGGLAQHAELLLRRGDPSMFEHVEGGGSGSLLRAIKFIVDNPVRPSKSFDWTGTKKSALRIAYRHYQDADLAAHLEGGAKNAKGESDGGNYVYFTKFTHAVRSGIEPAAPPTVPAP